MTDAKKNITLLIVLVLTTILVIYLYLLDYADSISNLTNYFVGLSVFPVLVGVLIGSIGAFCISVKEGTKIRKYYFFPLVCGLISMVPIAYVLLMMSLE